MLRKQLLISALVVLCFAFGQVSAQNIQIKAYTKCKVALINKTEIGSAKYGWWSAWQTKKKSKAYKTTPCNFNNISPGTYTLVVYNPNASTSGSGGDGVVLKEIVVGKKFNLKAYYDKSDFKEWNCLSCPWLYVYEGNCFVKKTEILKDVVGTENKTTTRFEIAHSAIKDGILKIKVQEEKDEITHIDQLHLRINGKTYLPQEQGSQALAQNDGQYKKLKKGDSMELTFKVPALLKASDKVILESTGFYIPDAKFLAKVYKKYLITDK